MSGRRQTNSQRSSPTRRGQPPRTNPPQNLPQPQARSLSLGDFMLPSQGQASSKDKGKAKVRDEHRTPPNTAFHRGVQEQNLGLNRQPGADRRQDGPSNTLGEFPSLAESIATSRRRGSGSSSAFDSPRGLEGEPGETTGNFTGQLPGFLGNLPTLAASLPTATGVGGPGSGRAFDPQHAVEGEPGETSNSFTDGGIDLSRHLPSTSENTPAGNDGVEQEWADFLLNRYYHCYRINKRKRDNAKMKLDEIQQELDIYATSHRGRHSLLPLKPQVQTRLRKVPSKVVANHFKVHFENKEIHLYSIEWHMTTYLSKNDKWNLWLKIVDKFNGIEPLYNCCSLVISPKTLETRGGQLIRLQYTHDGGIYDVTISYIETLHLSHNQFLGVDENGTKLPELENQVHVTFPEDFLVAASLRTLLIKYSRSPMTEFPGRIHRISNMIINCQNLEDPETINVGRYWFDKSSTKAIKQQNPRGRNNTVEFEDPHEFLCTMSGYFGSVRALEGGLNLNLDVMTTGFYKPDQTLKDTWYKMLQSQRIPDSVKRLFFPFRQVWEVNEDRARTVTDYWKNMKIVSTHRRNMPADPGPKFFAVGEVTSQSADRLRVRDFEDNADKDFIPLMRHRYRLAAGDLESRLPAIKLAVKVRRNSTVPRKDLYLPWGCCTITHGSRFPGKLEEPLLRKLERDVPSRYNDISARVELYRAPTEPRATPENKFTFEVEDDMMEVDARALQRPDIWVRGNQRLADRFGPQQQFMHPATVMHWGVLSFLDGGRFQDVEKYFIDELVKQARERGMTWSDQRITIFRNWGARGGTDERRKVQIGVTSFMNEFERTNPAEHLDLILCFMGQTMTPQYATLKYLCDIHLGVPCQVVLLTKKHLPQIWRDQDAQPNIKPLFVANVLLKINVKCGGKNFQLCDAALPNMMLIREESTMLLGADVTHSTRSSQLPSIAAVVATTDRTAVNYACRLKAQPSGEEIMELREMVKELLDVYRDNNGRYPDNILFFRDGIGESQYFTSLSKEGRAILEVAKTLRHNDAEYKPKLVIVVAIKRHHTRFFVVDDGLPNAAPLISNLDAGTVVVSGVTHPREYDFFLCSHAPGKGTSRPTHYYVLLDQINIPPDNLYQLVYNLCHTFQRCPKSVALVTPAYYAHLAAFRGKVYMEYYNTPQNGDLTRMQYQANDRLKNRLWFL